VFFLIVESDWKAINTPSTPTIYPKKSNQNFEIAILFKVVEGPEVISLRMTLPPQAPGQGLSVIPWGHIRFLLKALS
jgi:hypothetical protein